MSGGVPFGGDGYFEVVANSLVSVWLGGWGAGWREQGMVRWLAGWAGDRRAGGLRGWVNGRVDANEPKPRPQLPSSPCPSFLPSAHPPSPVPPSSLRQSPDSQQFFTGTAGCVRHFLSYFDSNTKNRFIEDIMILPG